MRVRAWVRAHWLGGWDWAQGPIQPLPSSMAWPPLPSLGLRGACELWIHGSSVSSTM